MSFCKMSYGAIEREEAFCEHMDTMVTLMRQLHPDHVRQSSCPYCAAIAYGQQQVDESRNDNDDGVDNFHSNHDEPEDDDDARFVIACNQTCNQCVAVMVNNVYCHEHGCPNSRKVKMDGEWVDREYAPDYAPDDDADSNEIEEGGEDD